MDIQFYQSRLKKLLRHQHIAWRLNMGLMAMLFLMLGLIYWLIGHSRTVIIPATLSEPIWIESNRVSNSYLAEMGVLLLNQYLTISAPSFNLKRNLLLHHIAPELMGYWQKQLTALEEKLKHDDIAMVFFTHAIEVDSQHLVVTIKGDLQTLIHETRMPIKPVRYQLHFQLRSGRLWLTTIEELQHE